MKNEKIVEYNDDMGYKRITIESVAHILANKTNGKITHHSKSGSYYIKFPDKEFKDKYFSIRISNHWIASRTDFSNPSFAYDYEFVARHFDYDYVEEMLDELQEVLKLVGMDLII